MRVETLTLNFSIKDNLKIVSKTKMEKLLVSDRSGITLCITYTVNLESLKTLYKKTIYVYIYIFLKQTC